MEPSPVNDGANAGADSWNFGGSGAFKHALGGTVGRVNLGQRVAQFELIDVLGRGGMGAVYRARDVTTGREVALKVMLGAESGPNEKALARFQREGAVTAALRDAGVVAVHTAGVDNGCPYIAYELIEGARSLKEAWSGLALEGRVRLVRDAAHAVGAAHQKGITHRDLKPENILVDATGRVRVADFGLATLAGASRLTLTGALVGTPLYMSPEQMAGEEPHPPMDTWALGVVLYEAICDAVPFIGANVMELMSRIAVGTYTPPRTHNPDLPEAYAEIVSRALAVDPNERYPDAAALTTDLDRALAGDDLRRSTTGARALWRAHGKLALATGAAATLAVVALTYSPMPEPVALPKPTNVTPIATNVAETLPTAAAPPRPGPVDWDVKIPRLEGELAIVRARAVDGDTGAMRALASLFRRGDGTPKNRSLARELYEAVVDDEPKALADLAHMAFEDGDAQTGVQLLEQAGKRRPESWTELGRLCERGLNGVPKDVARAVELYARAASAGHHSARAELGRCRVAGLGGPQDATEGLRLLRDAATYQNTSAFVLLGRILLTGQHGVPKRRHEALRYLRMAYDRKRSPDAAFLLGVAAHEDGDRELAVRRLRFAARTLNVARVRLAEVLLSGDSTPGEIQEAVDTSMIALSAGAPGAAVALADAIQTPGSSAEAELRAEALLAERAKAGDAEAVDALQTLRRLKPASDSPAPTTAADESLRASACVAQAKASYNAKAFRQAITLCTQALAIDPKCAEAYATRGAARYMANSSKAAEVYREVARDYVRYLELAPNSAGAPGMRKYVLETLGPDALRD